MRLAIVAAPLILIGCTDAAVETCEDQVKAKLKAPSSYQRIEAFVANSREGSEQLRRVFLEYDAENLFGATIRYNKMCEFRLIGGRISAVS